MTRSIFPDGVRKKLEYHANTTHVHLVCRRIIQQPDSSLKNAVRCPITRSMSGNKPNCVAIQQHERDHAVRYYTATYETATRSHIMQLICTCFGVLRQIRSIHRSLPRESALTLISSLTVCSCPNWITAMSPSPDCHAASWTDCSLSLMPPHVSQSGRSVITTSRCCSPTCSDCRSLNASITNSVYWFSIAWMGQQRDIYKRSSVQSRTLSHDVVCALPPRQT